MAERSEILQLMRQLSKGIGLAVVAEGLTASLVRAKRGPLTITYHVRLGGRFNTADVNRLANLGTMIQEITGYGPVRAAIGKSGGVFFEFPSPWPERILATRMLAHMQGANIAVGLNSLGEPAYVNLKRNPNIVFVGPPSSGKTTAMQAILFQILMSGGKTKTKFFIFSTKQVRWRPFLLVPGSMGIYSNTATIKELLQQGVTYLTDIASSQAIPETNTFIIIDDYPSLLQSDPDIGRLVGILTGLAREFRTYLFIGTQSMGSRAGAGGMVTEDNLTARIVYSTASTHGASRATGGSAEGVSQLTNAQGDAVLVVGGETQRIATPYVDESILAGLPQMERLPDIVASQMRPKELTATLPPKELTATLPRVQFRELTAEEVMQVKEYIQQYTAMHGIAPSRNMLQREIYGNKGGPYAKLLKESMGWQ